MSRSSRTAIYAILIALPVSAILTHFLTTLLPTQPEQDECSFGPVTNDQYRAMLSKAKSIQRWKWLTVALGNYKMVNDTLMVQFLDVSEQSPSPYVKIAAIHAVMRSWSAEFRNSNGKDEVFVTVSKGDGTVGLNYSVAVPRFNLLSLPGHAWFIGSLNGPSHSRAAFDRERLRQGRVEFITYFPNPLDPIPHSALLGENAACPPVPPRDLESFFAGSP